jgi:hypothetical protein
VPRSPFRISAREARAVHLEALAKLRLAATRPKCCADRLRRLRQRLDAAGNADLAFREIELANRAVRDGLSAKDVGPSDDPHRPAIETRDDRLLRRTLEVRRRARVPRD